MRELHGNLHRLSEANWRRLKGYYANGTLTSQDQSLLLSEITKHSGTLTDVQAPD